ncbi:DUF262 domain-containing protein [Ferrovum myxofaciens]|uniref:DUF262 domain-containing protein n=1 Tax=Ferrovum myxofaciens TaxID=416213 RepID=UPI00068D0821|nr:DUF262 domain-containing protein [Ferrovum myxofaciens]
MPDTSLTIGKQASFCELFKDFQRIQIPIIQRDYAQGRLGQEELRKDFLTALKTALDAEDGDPIQPLDLDFVYGSAFGGDGANGGISFAPLDGQQRLTTLFLLHWYLAWKDGESNDFQERFVDAQRSRFSYEVRPSSHDFFNSLALNFPVEYAVEIRSLQALIQDKSWFFRSWTRDPTIVSSLTMLEEIHKIFLQTDHYYQRLVDPQHRRITFQLLELKSFGLSDDLYIKMNARGKPLTPFETFKARLEQHLDELLPNETIELHGKDVSIKEYFSHSMDTKWANLFWAHRNQSTHLYDDEVMRLIQALALVCVDPEDDGAAKSISTLRLLKSNVSYSRYFDGGFLNKKMLDTLIVVLDYWSGIDPADWIQSDAPVFDSRVAFEGATSRDLSYPDLSKFAAFCAYVHTFGTSLNPENLKDWLRVVSNLVENSDIERPTDFVEVLKSIGQLENHADDILDYLANGLEVTAFNRQQVREERIKAALLLKGIDWRNLIVAAEEHGYFNGQIEFLLKFSGILDHWLLDNSIVWSDAEDVKARDRFAGYWKKARAIFDSGGLRSFPDHKCERALLSLGDYMASHGRNRSFLQNKSGSGERRPTWKLLLRGHILDVTQETKRVLVKDLFDKIDLEEGVEASLDEVIRTASPKEPWMRMLVEDQRMILYCGQMMFRPIEGGAVYLISKLRTSSEHVELWSYYLYHTLLTKMSDAGTLSPFTLDYISANTEDYVPFAQLKWRGESVEVLIDFADERFRIMVSGNESEPKLFLIQELAKLVVLENENGSIFLKASADEIEVVINKVVGIARSYKGAI